MYVVGNAMSIAKEDGMISIWEIFRHAVFGISPHARDGIAF